MFILDSLFISGLRFVLDKVATTVDAELNDDTVLREELLAAEMRREMGEISDAEFARMEAELLARIREIKERREGSGPIAFGRDEEALDADFQVEATVSGDFHEPVETDAGATIRRVSIEAPGSRPRKSRPAPGRRGVLAPRRRSRSPR